MDAKSKEGSPELPSLNFHPYPHAGLMQINVAQRKQATVSF